MESWRPGELETLRAGDLKKKRWGSYVLITVSVSGLREYKGKHVFSGFKLQRNTHLPRIRIRFQTSGFFQETKLFPTPGSDKPIKHKENHGFPVPDIGEPIFVMEN